jgi:hypothetical protein
MGFRHMIIHIFVYHGWKSTPYRLYNSFIFNNNKIIKQLD